MANDFDVSEYFNLGGNRSTPSAPAPNTAAANTSSGKVADGVAWLKDLVTVGLTGWLAVEQVKAERRNADSVTTQAATRVDGSSGTVGGIPSTALWIGGGIVAVILAFLLLRKR